MCSNFTLYFVSWENYLTLYTYGKIKKWKHSCVNQELQCSKNIFLCSVQRSSKHVIFFSLNVIRSMRLSLTTLHSLYLGQHYKHHPLFQNSDSYLISPSFNSKNNTSIQIFENHLFFISPWESLFFNSVLLILRNILFSVNANYALKQFLYWRNVSVKTQFMKELSCYSQTAF